MSAAVTLAILDEEFPILERRAERAGWLCALDREHLTLDLYMRNSADDTFNLRAYVDEYRALPPRWSFISKNGEEDTFEAFPRPPVPTPGGEAAIFIEFKAKPIICLPCNRLCYGTVHGDWQTFAWEKHKPQYTTLCEMANRIYADLRASDGRWIR